jgi:AraC-like DNA-binding protein
MMTLDQAGRGQRFTRVVATPPDLAAVVESVFVRHDAGDAGPWRIVPDPGAHLVITVSDAGAVRAAVVGARSTFLDTDVSRRALTLGVRLRPGTLPALAAARASTLTDRGVPASDVFGAAWRPVVAALDPADPAPAVRALFTLLRRIAPAPRAAALVAAARRSRSVTELATALDVPLRTLHAHAEDWIGLSPKRLLRVLRVHRALEAAQHTESWAAIAADTGFADQPHLVRELRELVGETPRQWRARALPIRTRPPS